MSLDWMAWNTLLAMVPLLLAAPLFAPDREPHGLRWWLGFGAFVAFLPNAPYVLTDVVHFAGEVRASDSDLHVAFVLIPKYGALFVAGFAAYAASVVQMERWLRSRGWRFARVLAVDVGVHGLCAVGIFLGRMFRLNSWDLVVRPSAVLDVVRIPKPTSIAILLLTFLVLAGGTATLRLAVRIRGGVPDAR